MPPTYYCSTEYMRAYLNQGVHPHVPYQEFKMPADTNGKTRTRNTNGPLTAGRAVDMIVKRRHSRTDRRLELARAINAFDAGELDWEARICDRVPPEQREVFQRMLEAACGPVAETDDPVTNERLNRIMQEQPDPIRPGERTEIDRSGDGKARRVGADRR